MKAINYPSRLTVAFDKDEGKKLDYIAKEECKSRRVAIIRAVEHYYKTVKRRKK